MPEAIWFKFDVKAFLFGTRKFKTEETGAYILMLCHQWDKGYIPKDEAEIEEISGVPIKKLNRVLKKFVETKIGDTLVLINERMDAEKREWNEYLERQASNGSKGGRPKKMQNPEKPTANPPLTQLKPKKSLIDKNRIEEDKIENINNDDDNARENEFQFPINVPPVESFRSLSEIYHEFTTSTSYQATREQLCIKYHITLDQLNDKANNFNLSLTCQGVSTKQISEWIRHFNNWVPKSGGYGLTEEEMPGSSVPDFTPTEVQVSAHAQFIAWMRQNTPSVARMELPITVEQLCILRGQIPDATGNYLKISKEDCQRMLMSIENNKEYQKKFRSPYLCLISWHTNKK